MTLPSERRANCSRPWRGRSGSTPTCRNSLLLTHDGLVSKKSAQTSERVLNAHGSVTKTDQNSSQVVVALKNIVDQRVHL